MTDSRLNLAGLPVLCKRSNYNMDHVLLATEDHRGPDMEKSLYHAPSIRLPDISQLTVLSQRLGINATPEELDQYREQMKKFAKSCQRLDEYAEPTLPVNYPRCPGYRPSKEENQHNAWYWKSEIRGSDFGLLKGKTLAIKDNIAVGGVPMMNGTHLLEGYIPEFDASVITKVLDAGGRIIGKASSEHMCLGGSSFTNAKGPILNPYDKTRSASGSSSGCAVLVSLGEVDMAIGGDQGGSIRMPASWCGIVGLKPTYGLVPYTGAIPIETSLDHLGPMARNVKDCALLLQVLAGHDDGLDMRQREKFEIPNYMEKLTSDIKGLKIAIVNEGFEDAEPDVDRMVKNAANMLQQCGVTIEEINIPMLNDGAHIWSALAVEGGYEQMIRGLGPGIGSGRGFYPTTMAKALARGFTTQMNDSSPMIKTVALYGEYMRENYGHHYYFKGSNLVRTLKQTFDNVLEEYDAMILPTIKFKAPKLPEGELSETEWLNGSRGVNHNVCSFNVTGHPALSINVGFSEGLPVGMMIVGRHFQDDLVLNIAYQYELIRNEQKTEIPVQVDTPSGA